MHNEYFECSCNSDEHRLVFTIDEGSKDWAPEIYTSTFLCQPNNFLKRVWIAITYIFGYKSLHGHFDCFAMKPQDAPKFQLILADYIEKYNTWVKELKERGK